MKYEKNQYTDNITFCGLLIAGAFIWSGITTLIGLQWWGIFTLIIGTACLGSMIYKYSTKSKLLNVVKFEFEKNPNASVEDVCRATGFSKKDVQAMILDLKATGNLKGSFSTKTGQIKATPKEEKTEAKAFYCPNCGTQIKKDGAVFCNYCGAKLE